MTGERQWAAVAGVAGLIVVVIALILLLVEKISTQLTFILCIIAIPLLFISALLFSPVGKRIFSQGSKVEPVIEIPEKLEFDAPQMQSEPENQEEDHEAGFRELSVRIEYLSLLNHALNDYVERVDYLALCGHDVVDLDLYRQTYIKEFKTGNIKYNPGQQLVYELHKLHVFRNNLVLRAIVDTDHVLRELGETIERLSLQISDPVIRDVVKEFREAVHIGYSHVVFDRLLDLHFDELPLMLKYYPRNGQKMIERIKEIQARVNGIMDKLVAGAEVA